MTTIPTAVFRFDVSPAIGGGHRARCLALADALRRRGWQCALAVRGKGNGTSEARDTLDLSPFPPDTERRAMTDHWSRGVDALIVDHYDRGHDYEGAFHGWARCVVAFDDQPTRHHDPDLLIDPAADETGDSYEPLLPPNARVLAGPSFACLRRAFAATRAEVLAERSARFGRPPRHLLLAFGLTDPGNLTGVALDAVAAAGLPATVDVVLSRASPHLEATAERIRAAGPHIHLHVDSSRMTALMGAADVAIGAAGGSSWERAVLGLPTIAIIAAGNQRATAHRIRDAGAALVLDAAQPNFDRSQLRDQVVEALQTLASDPVRLAQMSRDAADCCDGAGAERVADAITGTLARVAAKPEPAPVRAWR